MQKVLVITTNGSSLRSSAQGWNLENGDLLKQAVEHYNYKYSCNDIPVGLIGCSNFYYCYATPLHAIGDGWKLLAPPQKINSSENLKEEEFEWWFTKD